MAQKIVSGGVTYWTTNAGEGYYATEAEAKAAETGGTNQSLAIGGNTGALAGSVPATTRPQTMADRPDLIPGYGMTREQLRESAKERNASGQGVGIGGADTVYRVSNQGTRDAFDATHQVNQGGVDWSKVKNTALDLAELTMNPFGQIAETAGLPQWAVTAANFTSPYGIGENAVQGAKWVADASSYRPEMGSRSGGASGAGLGGTGGYDILDPEADRPYNDQAESAVEGAMEDPDTSWVDRIYQEGRDLTESQNLQELEDARNNRAMGLQLNTDLLNKLLSYDPEADANAASEAALRQQLQVANSARGGAGARASALYEAQAMAPELQARAMEQAQATENQRLGQAAQVAGTIGQLSSTQFGQEADYDIQDRNIGTQLFNGLVNMGANEANIEQKQRENLGRIANDLNNTDFNWQKLSSDEKLAAWNNMVETYGIDERTRVELERIAAENRVTPLDILEIGLQSVVTAKKVGAF